MVTSILDVTGSAVLLGVLVVVAVCGALLLRYRMLARGGATLYCGLRVISAARSTGWHLGIARCTPTQLQWFRLVSLAPSPARTFERRGAVVDGRREPRAHELNSIPHARVLARCQFASAAGGGCEVELGMNADAWTGLLSWLESAPPGANAAPGRRREA